MGTDGRGMRRGAKVPSRRRRDGRVRNERKGDPRARNSARRFVCQVGEYLFRSARWSKVVFERIPIGRRVRARGAVGGYHAEFGAQECVSRFAHAYRSRVARVSSVVTPSLLAR